MDCCDKSIIICMYCLYDMMTDKKRHIDKRISGVDNTAMTKHGIYP